MSAMHRKITGVILETIYLNVSAGSGPEECAKMTALTVQVIRQELQERLELNIKASIIESVLSREKGNIRSALLELKGQGAKEFANSWTGVIQWIWQSAYRPHHKRKNWFVQVLPYSTIYDGKGDIFSLDDVRFETAKASGNGGQHVNKTESAVRAVHIPSGKSAYASDERSQLMNKRLALSRLAAIFAKEEMEKQKKSKSDLRHSHWELERGNPVRVYDGLTLKLLRKKNGK